MDVSVTRTARLSGLQFVLSSIITAFLLFLIYDIETISAEQNAADAGATAILQDEIIKNSASHNSIDELQELSRQYRRTDPQKSIDYATQALIHAREIKDIRQEALALRNMANAHVGNGSYDEAVSLATEAYDLAVKLDDHDLAAKSSLTKAVALMRLSRYPESLEYHDIALGFYQKLNDQSGIAGIYNNKAAIFDVLGDYVQGQAMLEEALIIWRTLGKPDLEALSLNNLGELHLKWGNYDLAGDFFLRAYDLTRQHSEIGNFPELLPNLSALYLALEDYDRAIAYAMECLEVTGTSGVRIDEGLCRGNLARAYIRQGKVEEGKTEARNVWFMAEEIKNPGLTIVANQLMMETYFTLGLIERARIHGRNCIETASAVGNRMAVFECSEKLAEIEALLGHPAQAYEYLKVHNQAHAQLFSSRNMARLQDYQARYNLEKSEKEGLLLKKNNEILKVQSESDRRNFYYTIVIFLIALMASLFLFLLYRKQRRLSSSLSEAIKVAEAATQAKSLFLTRMSHELRTPLNAILGFGQLLEMGLYESKQKGQAEKIVTAGRHLLELINEILDLARIESGRLEISVEELDLSDLLEDCETFIRPLADKAGLDLRVQKESVKVQADRTRLKQVLLNLMSNAVKYNQPDGKIDVSLEKPVNGQVLIRVRDTGHGIGISDQKRLFQPFERLSQEGSTIEGSGMGLVIARELILKMGGEIGLESKPGEGSTFWIRMSCQD